MNQTHARQPVQDRRLVDALLRWGSTHRRDLPWRHTRDPWKIHVAEVMLQQTQVDRVQPRWTQFVALYPRVTDCAAAPVADIITLWVGLGFNRRAVLLHEAARVVRDDFDGRYPDDLVALESLPGIGTYTARAIACFAFERDVGIVDTNVGRVLARWSNRLLSRREVQTRADDLVPDKRGWEWNQTLFDLGATICTRRRPDCERCPVTAWCRWHLAGRPEPDPAVGSGGTSSPQSRFVGSDRQGRGRLVQALVNGPIPMTKLASAMGWPDDPGRARRVAETMVADALIELDGADREPGHEVVRLATTSSSSPRQDRWPSTS